jgi:hypothetical protein
MFLRRVAEDAWRRSRVSDTVVAGDEVNSASRVSMAAIGGVREESSASNDLYFWTMSKSGPRNCRPFACDGDLACFEWPAATGDTNQHDPDTSISRLCLPQQRFHIQPSLPLRPIQLLNLCSGVPRDSSTRKNEP